MFLRFVGFLVVLGLFFLTSACKTTEISLFEAEKLLPSSTNDDCVAAAELTVNFVVSKIPHECPMQKPFSKYVQVFGINVFATSSVPEGKILHAANVMAQYLDNDEDHVPDDLLVLDVMHDVRASLFIVGSELELEAIPETVEDDFFFQDLFADEIHPEWHVDDKSEFDATLEEVLHLIQHAGWAVAHPEIFGITENSLLAEAMDHARGGKFDRIPANYPEGAWYRYEDETCDYSCQIIEYAYWVTTTLLGAQDYPGRFEEISEEWKLTTLGQLQEKDRGWKVITLPDYNQPTKRLPDGQYRG